MLETIMGKAIEVLGWYTFWMIVIRLVGEVVMRWPELKR